ncbi:hypothetical protein ACS0TY_031688 [Phlomoides rotata]
MVLILSVDFLYVKESSIDLLLSRNHLSGLTLYFFNRSTHLKRLTLHGCYYIWGTFLGETIKKLPHLEELHLNIMELVYASDIETIGKACPMLMSFSFNQCGSNDPHPFERTSRNECALAIAKNMPNLRHLRLFLDSLNNEGLEAILDGCPYLESLDLRQCFHLHLCGVVAKRCYEQLKDLKCPYDSIKDIEWLK